MQHHHAAAPLKESLQPRAILRSDVIGVGGVKDEHIRFGKLRRRGKPERAVGFRAAIGEQLSPVGEKLRVIVFPRPVGLLAGADEHAERGCACPRGDGEDNERENDECKTPDHGFGK